MPNFFKKKADDYGSVSSASIFTLSLVVLALVGLASTFVGIATTVDAGLNRSCNDTSLPGDRGVDAFVAELDFSLMLIAMLGLLLALAAAATAGLMVHGAHIRPTDDDEEQMLGALPLAAYNQPLLDNDADQQDAPHEQADDDNDSGLSIPDASDRAVGIGPRRHSF